jgi:hypothetical protein
MASHPHIDFVSVRLEDAFDPAWWARVGTPPLEAGITLLGAGSCADISHDGRPPSVASHTEANAVNRNSPRRSVP